MAAYTVYLDQVFLGNLVMNYAILWSAAKLGRAPAGRWRLAAGAALGSAYSLALFFPGNSFLMTVWFKTAASIVITATVFAPVSLCKFLTCLGCFYLSSFALGGLTLGLIFFSHSGRLASYSGLGGIIAEHFWPGIFLGLAAFYAAAKGIAALIKSGYFENLFNMRLIIKSDGGWIKVDAFLDTGNHLKDPMTRRPVIVAEYAVLKPLLPEEARNCFEREGEPDVWGFLGSLGDKNYASRFTAVPFQSLGNVNGLMVGFRPDEVLIESQGRQVRVGKVVIAIYHKKLDPGGSYHALLSSELLAPVS
ncbi:sigma-E processing peptidase SpoIIGA [Pelotomaculum propionicicum]|uniref:Sporulation sigma-E factor-processing peptidase n=1 Tax=Pelotomaculum propionicicum TaxID=258475 RepID=A0A4Y7RW65_9FIRM|nr:sigma-E processing peptidase SpoIIGA [Pelotomaculum propionicicum]NLI12888.1 sigma-E processing peptidase SpoIIGA [Peptococcaceae bacterium]TEB13151.1 Sporulation sigma-E factor-processing peptidase [Pelotomaculum propionicicum]